MTEGHTQLNPHGALVVPNGFIIGDAAGAGDCFFDSVAQGMNQLCITGGPFDVRVLREACFNYADCNQGSIYDNQTNKTWRQAIEDDAFAEMYATKKRKKQTYFHNYLVNIELTAAESSSAIWGRPRIEGRMLCQIYGIKLHIIENCYPSGHEVIGHQLVDNLGSRSVDEHSSLYNDPQIIHILNEGLCHFTPILRKTSVPNDPIEKEVSTSLSDGVQSQNNPTYGLKFHPEHSVAASQQEVSPLLAQSERREQTPVKIESASEMNTHLAVDNRYLKECSLTDNSTWSAVAAKKEDADFIILKIRNSSTVSEALDFMRQVEFYETFNQASHWFFIVIEVADCSEFPSKALECLAEVLDKQKPVIIQWDVMNSVEHLVFFKQTGQSVFTPLQMNSANLFSTEDQLILELSKQGSFQLPLLLKALQLGIGGQFNGGALDLLNVSFDVKRKIDTWRLIDYAARDDDNLSLRFLLLFDWELQHKNGGGKRTLEIAAEYGGPQSMSALLNLPIINSGEEYFLNEKEKGLLALRNDLGDNPLLIAAEKGRPETLQFLIYCGADILCHRQGNENVTAMKLAWDEGRYENVRVLLEADSPFPDDFDLIKRTAALLGLVKVMRRFHQAIIYGSQTDVKEFIKDHPRLKRAYDPSNQSALMTSLKARQCEIYALLQSEGFCAGKNEELSEVIKALTKEERERLRQAKLQYFGKQDDSHIIYLLSKSRLGIGQEKKKNFGNIRELYTQLDTIPEISTVLKVVESSPLIEIIFDFDNDSIVDLDPTESSGTKGSCYYREGRIYIGAKDESKVLGTLAHELTHLAMQVCYDNRCNPYEALDEQKKCAFRKIVEDCRDRIRREEIIKRKGKGKIIKTKGTDEIIKRVFNLYEKPDWPSELIVRVPHILAHYKREKGKRLLTQQVPELLRFYKQHTQEDLKRFIENHACIKARYQIRHLNALLGKLNEIEQSKISLKKECLFNDDILNGQHIWILSSSLPQLNELNLYQVLRRKGLSLPHIESDYIFVPAEQFKNQEKADLIYEAFHSVTHPTLIIHCSYEYDKCKTDLWSTLDSFSEKRRIIFIAVADVAQSLQDKLKKYQVKMIQDRNYTWSDLTTDFQNELLKNTVCFQGSPVPLNKLISAESPVTKFLSLADLLEKRTLEIGRPLLTSAVDGCFENYYIPRTFSHQVTMKKHIFEQKFSDLVATNEEDFIKCCQLTPERNVHWLLKDKSGRLIWQQSRGSLRALHDYIDKRNPVPYPPENLDEFLQKAQSQKVMLIADTAGMGKTTVLTYLSKQIKQKFPTYWVVRIDLNDHADVLKDQMSHKIGTLEFLCEKLLKFRDPFEKELFKQCSQGLQEATKVVLMLDGFDEISPKYKETVLDLLQELNHLNQTWIEQLWVTTRPHFREELEDNLRQLCYTLEPFSEENQVGFLTKFWDQNLKLQEQSRQRLEKYARALIELLAQSISDKEREFTGIPLQTQMLGEVFEKKVETYCLSQKSELKLPIQLCVLDLYRKIIKKKINIFISKGEIAKEQIADITLSDISITRNHQILAMELLLPEMKDTVLNLEATVMLENEAISRIGIVQYVDDKPHFIHRTFAEYYVADFLAKQLTKETQFTLEVLNIVFNILLGKEYEVTRHFLDGLLAKLEETEAIKQYGKQIHKIWKDKIIFNSFEIKKKKLTRHQLQEALLQAAAKGSTNIIAFFFVSLKATGNTNTIKEMLQKQGGYPGTAWHEAVRRGHIETLRVLWGWGKEVQVILKDDLLLAKRDDGLTAWDMAAMNRNKEILETLWGWGKEVQVNLKDDLLLAKGYDGQTAWDLAAERGDKEILEKLWGWGKVLQVNLKDDLLLTRGDDGLTAWDRAAMNSCTYYLGWYELISIIFDVATGGSIAENNCNKEILETLWCWGKEIQVNLKDDLLLAKGYDGLTAWDIAAMRGDMETLETLWGWGKEVQVNIKDDLLLAKGGDGLTAWDRAAMNRNKIIKETLWGRGKKVQVNLKDYLLLGKGYDGLTAWSRAKMNCNKKILETLWGWGKEVQVNLKNDLLLAKGDDGLTAWDRAAMTADKEILETLWGWGKEVQVNLKDDLLLAKGYDGKTAWDFAAMTDDKENLETLSGWGKEVQVNLKNDLLPAKGCEGKTAWEYAVMT